MADQNANLKGYSYQEMSSKVERAEPTGEVESLRGRNDVGRMGDRLTGGEKHARPSELLRDQQKKKKAKKQQPSDDYGVRRSENVGMAAGGQSILEMDNLTGYQPTTQTARAAYETILTTIGSKAFLGNQSPSVLRDAAEEVIKILKDGSLRDPERHDEISRLLTGKGAAGSSRSSGGMGPEKYAEFVRLGKRLDDYDEVTKKGGDGVAGDANNQNGKQNRVDDEMGVAVVFDDSDDEDDDQNRPEGASDIEDGVVIDASSDSEDDVDENYDSDNS
eukprot:CAMPEP_0116134450 /NCGR_PEP_ID=MMETSP0329-20121206/10651_1 /TAXON_ID=697910 /ORGANISM="Pseudo-nitzschia arenysensis, Strain B593" /LENGTH=275 /DNA_ID=CAMNT_0003629159 /DNA_START=58 /DNA_END=882 /DNA_ORIENTATION=-